MAIYHETQSLMLGTRLKRLSDKFMQEISAIYKNLGVEFEASWFPVFYLLEQEECISISDIAKNLEISQSAVSQMVLSLEHKNLIAITQRASDRRVREISLTEYGKQRLQEVLPIWETMQSSLDLLLQKGDALLNALNDLENQLQDNALSNLVLKSLLQEEL